MEIPPILIEILEILENDIYRIGYSEEFKYSLIRSMLLMNLVDHAGNYLLETPKDSFEQAVFFAIVQLFIEPATRFISHKTL